MRKTIVISAINFFEGGPLSILRDCVSYLENNLADQYNIIVYVHNVNHFSSKKISFIELPKSRKSYINRLYYEYIWFYFQSIKHKPFLWFSLHDITPNVKSEIRAVYCHNPSPFYEISMHEFILDPTLGFFNKFYKYLYKININKNHFVVVQQNWLRDVFRNMLNSKSEIIVAPPNVSLINKMDSVNQGSLSKKSIFFFPALPRVFKNFECVCEATKLLNELNLDFELQITLSGNENRYSKMLFKKYGNIENIKFIGILSREKVFEKFLECSALVFPSKLETWGLPITESKLFEKPILVCDLPYAHETVGQYSKVSFFEPNDVKKLASLMEQVIKNVIAYDGNDSIKTNNPKANNWDEMFNILLN